MGTGEIAGLAASAALAVWAYVTEGVDPNVIVVAVLAASFCVFRIMTAPSQAAAPLPPKRPKAVSEDLSKPPVTILFGSQTGTAELYAKNLGREAKKLGFRVKLEDLLDYDTSSLVDEKFVVFVVATYGEGEPTDTMKDFYTWFMSEERDDSPMEDYSGVSFACFGLGDSQYKHFCVMGKDIDKRGVKLGMKRLCETGLGDSDKNLEEDFDNWRSEMWQRAAPAFGMEPRDEFADPPERTLQIRAHEPTSGSRPLPYPKTASSLPPTQKLPCWATITRDEELLKKCEGGRSTRHIELDVSESALASGQGGKYEGGDHLGILPANEDSTVELYAELLQLSTEQLDQVVSLCAADGVSKRNHLPARVPVRVALKWYFDLQGAPKKAVLRAFTHFTADEGERKEFQELLRVNDAAAQRYRELAARVRTVAGFLKLYPSTKVPLDVFMELMPRVQPRWYSIASDSLWETQRKSIHVCIAITDGGLCSGFLRSLQVGEKIPCFVRKSTFHLPQRDKKRPNIMIGPGTGVAPLIGFLYRRKAWALKGESLGETNFYFGCRSKHDDWLYQDLMEECEKSGVITKLRCAFSRDQSHKVYVQHLVREDGPDIWRLMEAGANIYICGDAKHMAKDVEEALLQIMEKEGGMTRDAAERRLNEKEKKSEYLKDVWTT
eukprot:TRINITY_DN1237_c0_g1_i1.p1 TRINITY_DN1237_c0_g1~~TRINITY_DN1237_c0_g1_i1.p1  ORF type:complete len:665 (+),score=277.07 TRINITY_DN1237_c0_g1_i1:73-2067(+)